MKKKLHLLFILLLLFSIKISAQQQYKPCLDEDVVKWSILVNTDMGLYSREYVASGNILINDLSYKKLYKEYFSQDFDGSDIMWTNYTPEFYEQISFFIRESDDASKLYLYNAQKNKEYLISDLNLQVGDKFELPEPLFNLSDSVSVDSVYIKNGLKHVQLNREIESVMNREKLTFIEGIGPNKGPFNEGNFGQILNCFQNQLIFYKYESDISYYPCGFCNPFAAIKSIVSKDYKLIIRENEIEIFFLKDLQAEVALYDIRGQLLTKKSAGNQKNRILPVSSLPKGIYLLKILNQNTNQISISKIIL